MSKERLVELFRAFEYKCPKDCLSVNYKDCNECKLGQLADYLLASGEVIVTPCKVGDTLYRVLGDEITEHKVKNMMYRELQSRWQIDSVPFLAYAAEHFNKSVFLTREEAEKRLKTNG